MKSSKFLCLKPLPLPEGPTQYSTKAYFQAELFPFIVALITLVLHRRGLRSGVNIRLDTPDYTPGRVYIFGFLYLIHKFVVMLGTCMYRCVILYCIHILCAVKAQYTNSWVYRQYRFFPGTLTKILLLLQERSVTHLPISTWVLRATLTNTCRKYGLDRGWPGLDLSFSTGAHKYSIFVAVVIWGTFPKILT